MLPWFVTIAFSGILAIDHTPPYPDDYCLPYDGSDVPDCTFPDHYLPHYHQHSSSEILLCNLVAKSQLQNRNPQTAAATGNVVHLQPVPNGLFFFSRWGWVESGIGKNTG